MKWILIAIAVVIGVVVATGNSENLMRRFSSASRAFQEAESGAPEQEHEREVVRKARAREEYRQEKTWTAENKQKEPELFLRDQLAEVKRKDVVFSVQLVELNTKLAELKRKQSVSTANAEKTEAYLAKAKSVYRECKAAGKWPATVNGFTFSKQLLKTRIVEASSRCEQAVELSGKMREGIVLVTRKIEMVQARQRKLVDLRAKIEAGIEMAKLKKTVEDIDGIDDQVNGISDQVDGLGVQADFAANLDDVMELSGDAKIDAEFEKIMAE